ncbi:UDP-4-amino-4,6-dideoxy-N-acetyl-beta-L-altrosamine transaminase, partial [Halomonas litopenaei]|nr:UDP-4-amino-4,6-dideoxy-N-acetyl-beta-L-altrosamine transaminase [Halomonas litopenaei]
VLVDVERETMNIDPAAIESAITPRTKAIIVVHFAGRPCNMDAVTAIAAKHDLLVIEDAAHAIEARYKGRNIGTISPLTCYSFYVTKNITTGEGGMIAATQPEIMEKVKQYALHGLSADAWSRFSDQGYKHYEVTFPGFKYNMTDMQASLGLVQLSKIETWLERRNEIWRRYDEAFASLPCVLPAPEEENTRHARHLYTIMVDTANPATDRDTLITRLR